MKKITLRDTKPIVFSLGGSIIVPQSGIDIEFMQKFRAYIYKEVAQGNSFVIVCGGGTTCRSYQKAAREIDPQVDSHKLDWIGIHSIRLNAELLRAIFADIAYPGVIVSFDSIPAEVYAYPLVIAGAEEPGHSSDYDAVKLATLFHSKLAVNLSNTDRIYSADPKLDPSAEPYDHLRWDQVLELVGDQWRPGMNVPFDPVAAKAARDANLTVITCNGRDLQNLEHIVHCLPFIGTVME
ncbi:UMP kinase [candidate division WWE3 bacterium]|nr:UMP kinase [candidate division WWE3 bacterium]